jgi:hypothetical protein
VVENFNNYRDFLTTSDVKSLFKYCVRNKLVPEAHLVFSVHGSRDMLEVIKDEELKPQFQVNKARRKGGEKSDGF